MPDVNLLPEELRALEAKEKKKVKKTSNGEKVSFHEVKKKRHKKEKASSFLKFSLAKRLKKAKKSTRAPKAKKEKIKLEFFTKRRKESKKKPLFFLWVKYRQWRLERKERKEALEKHDKKQEELIKLFAPQKEELPRLVAKIPKVNKKKTIVRPADAKKAVKKNSKLFSFILNFSILLLVLVIVIGGGYFVYSKKLFSGLGGSGIELKIDLSKILEEVREKRVSSVHFTDYRLLEENKIFLKGQTSSNELIMKQVGALERISSFKKVDIVSVWQAEEEEIIFEIIIYLEL